MQKCRKVLPILSNVPNWYSNLHSYQCFFCNFSVAASLSRSLKTKELTTDEHPNSMDDNESALDSFADRLVQQKVIKWESLGTKKCTSSFTKQELSQLEKSETNKKITCQNTRSTKLRSSSSNEINKQFCHESRNMDIRPKKPSLSYARHLFARDCTKTSIPTFKDIGNILTSVECKKLGSYDLYLAEAMWRNGHFENALNLFWNAYTENIIMRKNIKSMLRALFANAVCKEGEAVLVLIINFSKKIVKKYNDNTFLSYVWEPCFLSQWHSDNQIASDLLEKYPELKDIVRLRVHHITSISLISHKIDVVQRLFEILLKYDMKIQYELVLRSLFDYACSVRDFYACSAIVQSCNDLDVTLTDVQNAQFLNLFCQQGAHRDVKLPKRTWPIKPSEFTFKF